MNLGKSDKIIAVVGVLIIVIAAIGIYFYTAPEEEEMLPTEPEAKTFYVTWIKETGEMPLEGKAEKTYNEPFTVIAPSGSVLTNVDFRLTWQDDHITGLILKRFQDTLKAEISLEGGEPQTDTSEEGCKNESILEGGFSVNDVPLLDSVEAEDIYEAEEIINEMIFGQDSASFDVKVTVTTGEKIRRPLKYLMDKGNSFEFKVVYEYYYPELEGEYNEDYDDEEGYEYQSLLGLFYQNIYCGRMI